MKEKIKGIIHYSFCGVLLAIGLGIGSISACSNDDGPTSITPTSSAIAPVATSDADVSTDSSSTSGNEKWIVEKMSPDGLYTRTYISDGPVTHDSDMNSWHFIDSTTEKTVYLDDRWLLTIVEE